MTRLPRRRHKLSRRALIAGAPAALAAAALPVTIASKIDTEGAVLGALIAAALTRAGIPVRTRLSLGPTRIVRAALLAGAIDLYPEYTGNGATFFARAGDPAWHKLESAWRLCQTLDAPNHLTWLPPAPANNAWGIALRPDLARRAGLKTFADLAAYLRAGGPLRLAASVEFAESPDALPAFERAYDFRLDQSQMLLLAGGDTSATLRAAAENISGINAAMAYATDGALEALGLVWLDDPRHAQIAFQPAPVIRDAALARFPAIAPTLAPLFASLTTERLRRLNARVAAAGETPEDVAQTVLATAP